MQEHRGGKASICGAEHDNPPGLGAPPVGASRAAGLRPAPTLARKAAVVFAVAGVIGTSRPDAVVAAAQEQGTREGGRGGRAPVRRRATSNSYRVAGRQPGRQAVQHVQMRTFMVAPTRSCIHTHTQTQHMMRVNAQPYVRRARARPHAAELPHFREREWPTSWLRSGAKGEDNEA